jgi:hypothetical protein
VFILAFVLDVVYQLYSAGTGHAFASTESRAWLIRPAGSSKSLHFATLTTGCEASSGVPY